MYARNFLFVKVAVMVLIRRAQVTKNTIDNDYNNIAIVAILLVDAYIIEVPPMLAVIKFTNLFTL